MGAVMAKRICVLCMLGFFSLNAVFSEIRSPRIVNLKIAYDEEFQKTTSPDKIEHWVAQISREYEARFGIRFHISKVEPWKSSDQRYSLLDLLTDLRQKVPAHSSDVVLGFTAQHLVLNPEKLGLASFSPGYIVMRRPVSERKALNVLKHEMAHLFGAVDLDEPGHVMHKKCPGATFHEFSSRIIAVHKHRSFSSQGFPLGEAEKSQAIAIYRERQALKKNEINLNLQLALIYLANKDYRSIEKECLAIVDSCPYCPEVFNFLGIARSHLGNYESAHKDFKAALSIDPTCPEIRNNSGINFIRMQKWDQAEKEFKGILGSFPGFAEAVGNLAYVYLRTGRPEMAAQECYTTLSLGMDTCEVMCTLGEALCMQGNFAEAERLSLETRSRYPGQVGPHHNLSQIYLKQKRYTDSIRECRLALEIDPDNLVALKRLATCYGLTGSFDKARLMLQRYSGTESDVHTVFLNLSAAYLEQKQYRLAIEACREALARHPGYTEAHANLAFAYIELGQLQEAESCCFRALENDPHDFETHNLLGIIFKTQGLIEKAEDEFLMAIQSQPDDVDVHLNLAHLYFGTRQFARSALEYKQALKLDPRIGLAYNNLAVIHFYAGSYTEAWDMVNKASETGFSVHPGFIAELKKHQENIRPPRPN